MVNLYQLLHIPIQASAEQIRQAIIEQRQLGKLNPQVLNKAEEWLLNPEVRSRYDAQLRAHDSSLFAAQTTTPPIMGLSEGSSRVSEPAILQPKPSILQQQQNQAAAPKAQLQAEGREQQENHYAALIGDKSDYYLNEFERIERGKRPSFNWMAMLGGGYWYATRGMWGMAIATLILPFVLLLLALAFTPLMSIFAFFAAVVVWLVVRLLYLPSNANAHYLKFAKKRIAQFKFKYAKQPERLLKQLSKTTNIGAGWALFAGVVVMSIPMLGIVAAIALPLYADYVNKAEYEKAYVQLSTLKTPIDAQLSKHGKVQIDQAQQPAYVDVSKVSYLNHLELNFDVVGEGYVQSKVNSNRAAYIRLLRDSSGLWRCEIESVDGAKVRMRDVPKGCKAAN